MGKKTKIVISASQVKTFTSCQRKWAFQRILRLDEPPREKDPRIFGDILHAVCERWLLADDLGRDPKTGEPVDLYPEGWRIQQPRFGAPVDPSKCVTVEEGLRIQKLVQAAIDNRILRRMPNRAIERRFDLPVLPADPDAPNYEQRLSVWIMGFLDVSHPGTAEDHKTSKNRKYLLGKKRLSKDSQMLIYGKALLVWAEEAGQEIPDTLVFRHNQFVKNPEDLHVRSTEVQVTREAVETFWTSVLVPTARKMRKVSHLTRWQDFPAPENFKACNDYGGCPYRRVCSETESADQFRKRVERLKNRARRKAEAQATSSKEDNVGVSDRLKEQRRLREERKAMADSGGSAAPPPAPRERPKEPPPPAVQRMPQDPEVQAKKERAPWHNEGCATCAASPVLGFKKDGTPCSVCKIRTRAQPVPAPSDFEIVLDGGQLFLIPNGEGEEIVYDWGLPEPTSKQIADSKRVGIDLPPSAQQGMTSKEALEKVEGLQKELEEDRPKAVDTPQVTNTAPPAAPPEPAQDPEPQQRGRGRPKGSKTTKGYPASDGKFTLCVNCYPQKKNVKLVLLSDLLHELGEALALTMGKESYYQLNAFDRRDAISTMVRDFQIPTNAMVMASETSPDVKAMIAALEPFAAQVFRGTV